MSSFNVSLPVAIGAVHAGFEYKTALIEYLPQKDCIVKDSGTSPADSMDYPDYAHPTAISVAAGENAFGILLCGTANAVCITANKHPGIRAALCWITEVTSIVWKHNAANIVSIPARVVTLDLAKLVNTFIATRCEGGRHAVRLNKMDCN